MTEPSANLSIWLIEDNDRFRKTLARSINQIANFRCDHHFASAEEAFPQIEMSPPDILMFDIGLPGIDGITALERLREAKCPSKILILTVFDDHNRIFRAICAGADGYLLKNSSFEQIESAIKEVMNGGASMSPQIARQVLNHFTNTPPKVSLPDPLNEREQEVLKYVVDGLTKKEIAEELYLSFHTIDSYLRSIYQKLHVNNRASAVAKAIKDGLV